MKVAIKVGGSVFCPTEKPDMAFVRRLAAALLELSRRHRLLVVVGGGRLARKMIEDAKLLNPSEEELHMLGILASRVNALKFLLALGENVFHGIPKDEKEAKAAFAQGRVVVTGGFRPGQTTDAVTLQAAEAIGADLVIKGTDVKGVYDRDPKKDKGARFLPRISVLELKRIVGDGMEPGKSTVFDPVAVGIIERTGVKAIVLDIRDIENLKNAVDGKSFTGTVIQ